MTKKSVMGIRAVGIDLGRDGAISFLEGHRIVRCELLPLIKEQRRSGKSVSRPDFGGLMNLQSTIAAFMPDVVIIEEVWAQRRDTPTTAFALGLWMGSVLTALDAFSPRRAAPDEWKKLEDYASFGLWGAGDEAKSVAVSIVRALYPDDQDAIRPKYKRSDKLRDPHSGMADAVLIARYGQVTYAR